jgi:transcriptional regulator with XRE-family HTH domain
MNLKKVSGEKKSTKSNIGSKIQDLLDTHGVSLAKVASATGLTSETIRQIINGTINNPGIETLSRIAEAFSVSLFNLLEAKDITSHINKKKIKVIDIFDLQKTNPDLMIDDLINQSVESTEILYIDSNYMDSEFFAVEVNSNLADKLTNCGMPMLKQNDLLIFIRNGDLSTNAIILAKCKEDTLVMGIIMEIGESFVWIKSVDIPQKQIVIKINKTDIVGIIHNVQFNK